MKYCAYCSYRDKKLKGSVTQHTIILKYVANQGIYEPTLCGFESLVTKFYTIIVYGNFRLKCVVIPWEPSGVCKQGT